jgi:hypothetical protein
MPHRFNTPPNWPKPPEGWTPPPGWTPDPSWPPAPYGWNLWVKEDHPLIRLIKRVYLGPAINPRGRQVARAIGLGLVTVFVAMAVLGSVLPAPPEQNVSATQSTTPISPPATPTQTSATPSAKSSLGAIPSVKPRPRKTTPKKSVPRKAIPRKTRARPAPKPKPATDPRYPTCKEANAHGYGPYTRGLNPEYDWYIDRDSDGVVCER